MGDRSFMRAGIPEYFYFKDLDENNIEVPSIIFMYGYGKIQETMTDMLEYEGEIPEDFGIPGGIEDVSHPEIFNQCIHLLVKLMQDTYDDHHKDGGSLLGDEREKTIWKTPHPDGANPPYPLSEIPVHEFYKDWIEENLKNEDDEMITYLDEEFNKTLELKLNTLFFFLCYFDIKALIIPFGRYRATHFSDGRNPKAARMFENDGLTDEEVGEILREGDGIKYSWNDTDPEWRKEYLKKSDYIRLLNMMMDKERSDIFKELVPEFVQKFGEVEDIKNVLNLYKNDFSNRLLTWLEEI